MQSKNRHDIQIQLHIVFLGGQALTKHCVQIQTVALCWNQQWFMRRLTWKGKGGENPLFFWHRCKAEHTDHARTFTYHFSFTNNNISCVVNIQTHASYNQTVVYNVPKALVHSTKQTYMYLQRQDSVCISSIKLDMQSQSTRPKNKLSRLESRDSLSVT